MSVLGEIKRRKVFQVAAVYLVASWLIMQVVDVVAEPLLLPDWLPRVVIVLLAIGFPIAIILSWAFDLTSHGVERTVAVTSGADQQAETMATTTGLAVNLAVIGALALVVIFVGVYVFWRDEPVTEAADANLDSLLDSEREVLPNSVAVLLCNNLSPNPDDAYFALSIHEEILNQLAKIRALNVIARTSVMQYADAPPPIPQIAEELNVGAVMECSVRYAGDAILVTAQLIDPETNSHIWSDTYPGDLSDLSTVFAMQADIAMNIANAIGAEFSLEEQLRIEERPTNSPEAYAAYLRALSYFDNTGNANANWAEWSGLFDRAIEYDPEFALAYAGKGSAYALHAPTEGWSLIARENVENALNIDPTLGKAYLSLALVHASDGKFADALLACDRAFELGSTDAAIFGNCGRINRIIGAYDDALRLGERALALDPNAPNRHQQLGVSYRYAKELAASASSHRRAIELDPSYINPHVGLAQTEAARGNFAEALQQVRLAEQLGAGRSSFRLAQMALVYNQLDRADDAMRLFRALEEMAAEVSVADSTWALAYLALDDYDRARQYLETAIGPQSIQNLISLGDIKSNYWGDPVLDSPPFRELRDRIGSSD